MQAPLVVQHFFLGGINHYLAALSKMEQVLEILDLVGQGPAHPTQISILLADDLVTQYARTSAAMVLT